MGYIGAKFIGNEPIVFGQSGEVVKPGEITKSLPEWEAIGRHDFEPIYDNEKNEINEKSAARPRKLNKEV